MFHLLLLAKETNKFTDPGFTDDPIVFIFRCCLGIAVAYGLYYGLWFLTGWFWIALGRRVAEVSDAIRGEDRVTYVQLPPPPDDDE